jgi:hypothetical protein
MPEQVWMQSIHLACFAQTPDGLSQPSVSQRHSVYAQEHGLLTFPGDTLPVTVKIGHQGYLGGQAKRHDPFLVAFATHLHIALTEVNVA